MVVEPLVANVPLQPPDAVQLVALVALHCNVTDAPTATVLSLALKLTNGGAATAGGVTPLDGGVLLVVLLVAVLLVAVLLVAVLLVAVLLAAVLPDAVLLGAVAVGSEVPDVTAFELAPHAASALSTVNTNKDFNANANPERRLRRIELITRLPKFTVTNFFRGA